MGRELRTIDPELAYHAICRGNNRGLLAWDSADFQSLQRGLATVASRHRWDVFAWCFLHSYYHVVLRTPFAGFSAGFRVMNRSHAFRTNRRHGRSDHLFRHRPHASAIHSDAHLVAAVLYVLRNPIAADIVENAAAWPYSSYRATVGLEAAPSWLALDELYPLFGSSVEAACDEIARLVHHGHLPVSDTDEETPVLKAGRTAA